MPHGRTTGRRTSWPRPLVLDEFQEEYAAYDTIRRSFVFTYRDRDFVEFFIAVMAWGLGLDPSFAHGVLRVRCWGEVSSGS
jgi:hypothetical protein